MKSMEYSENIQKDFWNDYINGDYFDRKDLMSKLIEAPILKNWIKHSNMGDEELKKYVLKSMLQSYFDDLLEELNSSQKPNGGKQNV